MGTRRATQQETSQRVSAWYVSIQVTTGGRTDVQIAHLPKPAEGVIYGPEGESAPCRTLRPLLIPGPLSSSVATSLRSSLSAAQGSFKVPHPAPSPSTSLASALFSSDSPLFDSASSADPSSDVNQTNPADPSSAPASSSASSINKDLAIGLARTLEVPLGLKLEKASLKWAGWETATNFAGSDAAPEGGYESLVDKVVQEAKSKGAEVKLNAEIKQVKRSEDEVTVTDSNGSSYTAKTAIITIPLGVLKTLPADTFSPALPPHRQETIAGTHVGVLEKLLVQYPTAWWPDAEKIGSYTFLPTSTEPLSQSPSLREVFEKSTLITANFAGPSLPNPTPLLLTYLSETPATAALKHSTEEVGKVFHEFLVSRLKPDASVPEPLAVELTTWLTDPLSKGATTTPSIVSEQGERSPLDFKELGRPVWDGKLGFAGEHTEMDHRGSVAGAVVSGYREAERVARLLRLSQGA